METIQKILKVKTLNQDIKKQLKKKKTVLLQELDNKTFKELVSLTKDLIMDKKAIIYFPLCKKTRDNENLIHREPTKDELLTFMCSNTPKETKWALSILTNIKTKVGHKVKYHLLSFYLKPLAEIIESQKLAFKYDLININEYLANNKPML